jgi:lipoic acid synthetase
MTEPIPQWLKTLVAQNKAALRSARGLATDSAITGQALHTVCHEALCPNRGKCFSNGEATFLILGNICTRGCKFCAVGKAKPMPPDPQEPDKIAALIRDWKLSYAVITSPTRDDLPDGGAWQFAATLNSIRSTAPATLVEPLIPDFKGEAASLKTVLDANPAVLAHNMETVPRLYASVRSGADYARSLKLIETAKRLRPDVPVKSGIMLGLGEEHEEIETVLKDLVNNGCDLLTLGQYLAPSKNHFPVARYVEPQEFDEWHAKALAAGFKAAACGPLVRSSYMAGELYAAYKGSKK